MKKRDIWIGICALCLAAVLIFGTFRSQAVEAGSWGLSFQTEGAAPIGNASVEQLGQYDGVYLGKTEEKTIYLTFDAGYENGCTASILDTLKKHSAPAVFFLVGSYIERNPELVKRMAAEGHTVGNHTAHHYDMSRISDMESFRKELELVEQSYAAVTGEPLPKFYRPPQGIYSETNLAMAKELGYKTVFWSLAYVDWKNDAQPTHEEAFSKLLGRMHPGAIVLLHSTSQTNAEILDELLTRLESEGYSFGSIGELFAQNSGR